MKAKTLVAFDQFLDAVKGSIERAEIKDESGRLLASIADLRDALYAEPAEE